MNCKIKVLMGVAVVFTLAGLATGGVLMTNRVALAADPVPAPGDNDSSDCSGMMGGLDGMMGGSGGMMEGYGMFLDKVTLEKIADLMKVSTGDIETQLKNGKSLIDIASSKASEQQLVDLLVSPHKEALSLRIKQGYLTQDEGNEALNQMEQAAKNFVNSEGQDSGPYSSACEVSGRPSTGSDPQGGGGDQGSGGMMGGNTGQGGMMGGNRGNGGMMGKYGL